MSLQLMKVGALALACASVASAAKTYQIDEDYEGGNFFNKFDFFSGLDPTRGYVQYQSQADASSTKYGSKLVEQRGNQNYIGVDYTNTYNPFAAGRPSVRLETKKVYNHGLFLLDLAHMPASTCGTWPAFWTYSDFNYPLQGEIDILENIHENTQSLNVLHTSPGFSVAGNKKGTQQTGDQTTYSCDDTATFSDYGSQYTGQGCASTNTDPKSYGSSLNAVGGGVYAMEWTTDVIRVWNFAASKIPSDIASGKPDPSKWGLPSFTTSQGKGSIDQHFKDHKVVLDTTFCGNWAGQDYFWQQTSCYKSDPVKYATCSQYVGANPSKYKDAYWLINSLKVYQLKDAAVTTSSSSTSSSVKPSSTFSSSTISSTSSKPTTTSKPTSSSSSSSSSKPTTSTTSLTSSKPTTSSTITSSSSSSSSSFISKPTTTSSSSSSISFSISSSSSTSSSSVPATSSLSSSSTSSSIFSSASNSATVTTSSTSSAGTASSESSSVTTSSTSETSPISSSSSTGPSSASSVSSASISSSSSSATVDPTSTRETGSTASTSSSATTVSPSSTTAGSSSISTKTISDFTLSTTSLSTSSTSVSSSSRYYGNSSTTSTTFTLTNTTPLTSLANPTTTPFTTLSDLTTTDSEVPMTTSTVYTTSIGTVTKCPATVINCPFGSVTTVVIPLYTTVSPVSVSATPTPTPIPSGENSGTLTTSTVYTTSVGTVTRCPVTVTNCPIGSLTTVIIPLYTTVCPVPEKPTAPAAVSTQPGGPILHVIVTGETTISAILTNLSPPTKTFTFNPSKYTTVPNQNPSGSNCPGCPPVTIVKTSTTVYTYPASSSSVKVVPPAVSTIIVYPTKPGNGTGVALPTTGGIVGTSSSTVIGGWKPSASVVSTASFVPVSGGSVFRVSRLMVLGMVGAIMM